jgi:glycosyltransferase involved in cell wall biosynthesis
MNQVDRLKMAISDIKEHVDEIIVIDGGSTDDTVKIAESLGAKVYFRKWDDDFGAQRNYSLDKASADWVVVLDSDESFKFLGRCNFQKLINDHPLADGFVFTRSNFLDNQKTGSVGDFDKQLRLFSKAKGRYTEKIHEMARGLKKVIEVPNSQCVILHYKSKDEQKQHLKYQRQLMVDFITSLENKRHLSDEEKKSLKYEKDLLKRWDIWWQDAQ